MRLWKSASQTLANFHAVHNVLEWGLAKTPFLISFSGKICPEKVFLISLEYVNSMTGVNQKQSMSTVPHKSISPVRIWLAAARPRTLGAAFAPVLIGTAMAFADGALHIPSALVALVCALLIQIGTNYGNDYFDFIKGADTAERIGPRRATQAGLVKPQTMLRATVLVFALAAVGGLYLIWRGGWPILLIGILSIVSGIMYTAGRRAIGYLGLGDLFVLIFFGPVAVGGTYYVQALSITSEVIIAGLAPGLLSVAILIVNNLRDIQGDRKVGKKTLAVRLGKRFAQWQYVVSVVTAALIPVVLYLFFDGRASVLIATPILLAAIPAFQAVFQRTGAALNPLLGSTNMLLLLYSALFSIGWIA
jgi:1,4-dihydroxy-2-naphthoate octaprenyltransferase